MIKFIKRIFNKFLNAFRGFFILAKEEKSLWFHFFSTIIVVILGFVFKVTRTEWVLLSLTIALVIGMEIMNTGLEYLVDLVSFEYNVRAKKVKDLGAAATLFASIVAIVVGLIIFIPYLTP